MKAEKLDRLGSSVEKARTAMESLEQKRNELESQRTASETAETISILSSMMDGLQNQRKTSTGTSNYHQEEKAKTTTECQKQNKPSNPQKAQPFHPFKWPHFGLSLQTLKRPSPSNPSSGLIPTPAARQTASRKTGDGPDPDRQHPDRPDLDRQHPDRPDPDRPDPDRPGPDKTDPDRRARCCTRVRARQKMDQPKWTPKSAQSNGAKYLILPMYLKDFVLRVAAPGAPLHFQNDQKSSCLITFLMP